jgi:hypothetical protein
MSNWDSVPGLPSCTTAAKAEDASHGPLDLGRIEQQFDSAPQRNRRWPRFAVNIAVQVRVTTQVPTRVLACEGQGTDLSCGGLAIEIGIDLPLGAQIGVEFTPPYSDQPTTFRGFVRNRDGNRYSVEFITENDDDYRKAGELHEGLAGMNANPT